MPVKTRVIKAAPSIEKTEEAPKKNLTSQEILKQYLGSKDVKDHHYNNFKEVDYTVSTGSLLFDIETGGGIHPSIMRWCGCSGAGKTSAALSLMHNFLKAPKRKRKGFYIKAEGRLSLQVRERSGINFVDNADEWKEGTCFVFKCNVYEVVIGIINSLIFNNPENIEYYFIFDSMDALIVKADVGKSADDAAKVAGGAAISSMFLKQHALAFSSFGHMASLISQVRSEVKVNQYQKTDPRLSNANGGNALIHYSDWIFEAQKQRKEDWIKDAKDKKIGHWARFLFRKSPNEKEDCEIKYPILYGKQGGQSVWVEYEIGQVLLSFELVQKNGAWFELEESLKKELEEKKLSFPPKVQGLDNLRGALMDSPEVTQFLYEKFKNTLIGEV